MYLKKAIIFNSGPIANLEVEPEFHPDGRPKPLVIVGANGSGKTEFLSIVTDGLIEVAAKHFIDVMPHENGQRAYYRLLGGPTTRLASAFEASLLRFEHAEEVYTYKSKAGVVDEVSAARLAALSPGGWNTVGGYRGVEGADGVEKIFREGAYLEFPSDRAEIPHWKRTFPDNGEISFNPVFRDRLGKPIIVSRAISDLKPWILEVILDASIDAVQIIQLPTMEQVRAATVPYIQNYWALNNLNSILRAILREPEARLVRLGRIANQRKIQVMRGDEVIMPSLDAFSAGQAILFAVFASIVRYGDYGQIARANNEIEGIVLIDEVDAHLHADLQHDALPALMRLFPKVQFIVSSHAPLFAIGLERAFGHDGFLMLDLPSGTKIDAERFSEFEKSFLYFQETKKFEAHVQDLVTGAGRPLVLCEGETDPIYLKAAAELLGMDLLAAGVDFDWVGQRSSTGAVGGGKGSLNEAYKLLRNNPKFLRAFTALMFDADAGRLPEEHGLLIVRGMPENPDNAICAKGIENLLPESVFSDQFYEVVEKRTADITTIRKLKKVELCKYLCEVERNPEHFSNFEAPLRELEELLFPR